MDFLSYGTLNLQRDVKQKGDSGEMEAGKQWHSLHNRSPGGPHFIIEVLEAQNCDTETIQPTTLETRASVTEKG